MIKPVMNLHPQKGVALLTALIVTLVLAITGVAIGKHVISSKRETSDYYDNTTSLIHINTALENAKNAIRDNQETGNLRLEEDDTIVSEAFVNNDWWRTDDNWVTNEEAGIRSVTVTEIIDDNEVAVAGEPTYIIERESATRGNMNMNTNDPLRVVLKITSKAQGLGRSVSYNRSQYAIMEQEVN